MSAPVSRASLVGALLKKEAIAYSRDTLYLTLTLASLVMVVALYWVMPSSVDDSFTLVVSPSIATMAQQSEEQFRAMGATDEQIAALGQADLSGQDGVNVVEFENESDLVAVVSGESQAWVTESGQLVIQPTGSDTDAPEGATEVGATIGISFPEAFFAKAALAASGAPGAVAPQVTVYADADVPAEYRNAMESFVRELAFQMAGTQLPVELPSQDDIILGTDRSGDQFTMREKLVPILAIMILMMETFSMSSLISIEVLQRTVSAILVTPVKVLDFLVAKTVFGTGMALVQGVVVLALVGAFTGQNWAVLLLILLIGSMMFTGVAMIVGAAGKDFIGQLFYAMMMTVPLLIPAFAVIIPGSTAAWVQVLPTYPLINSLVNATLYEQTFAELLPSIGLAAAWLVAIFGTGWAVLSRKVRSL